MLKNININGLTEPSFQSQMNEILDIYDVYELCYVFIFSSLPLFASSHSAADTVGADTVVYK